MRGAPLPVRPDDNELRAKLGGDIEQFVPGRASPDDRLDVDLVVPAERDGLFDLFAELRRGIVAGRSADGVLVGVHARDARAHLAGKTDAVLQRERRALAEVRAHHNPSIPFHGDFLIC